ncbi:MAG: SUMF1/EgtB/PvdO family nonheme iron enzyme [Planctomycetaceae bacterium]
MGTDDFQSLSDEATFAGQAKRARQAEVSLGGEQTIGGDPATQETVIDDIEVVDLESRYKVEGTLGQGGMGAVLLATDTRLGRKVAIKRILGEAARSKTAIARFLTEAKAIAALNHPNIVQIYDYGRANDGPFLLMEFEDGGSLADLCKAGAVPVERAVELICQVCDGLGRAHEQGIVHRDIKPANILINTAGLPKLTDFGLAKAEANDHGMTMAGAVMGTPDFMPPEQRKDSALVDHRSDLWSLAAAFYQLVTGRSPKIIRFKDVPEALHDVLGRALEEEKDARFQSARELRDALRNATSVAKPRPKRGAAPEPPVDLGTGECPQCHTVNDSQRKFCRECAASLRAPCLACDTSIPIWDKVCPECGKKQPDLLAAKRETLSRCRDEAELLRQQLRFDEAIATAKGVEIPADTRFSDYDKWRQAFLDETGAERSTAVADRDSKLNEAKKHRSAFDYAGAIHTLETIPETLRTNDVNRLLDASRSESNEAARLLETIRERIAAKELNELAPLVQRAMTLRGDRQDLPKLLAQLVEREQRLAARDRQQREWVQATANRAWEVFRQQGDARAALDIATPIERLLNEEQATQISRMRDAIEAEKRLGERLAAAKADGTITTDEVVDLSRALADCLTFMPKNPRLLAFRDQLIGRITKVPSDFILRQSDLHSFLSLLDTAALQALPEAIRGPFLAKRHLAPCPQCGVALKPSRMEWHLANKCPGANSGQARRDYTRPATAARSVVDPPGTVTNSIGMKFVPIPAGEFLMGCPANCPLGDPKEQFQHRVRITKPFFLGMHQVTQEQYERVVGANPSAFKGKNLPVEHLSWKDADRFCKLLSSLSAEQQDGRCYRLPTEAEWEYACRAGTTTPFNTGNRLTPKQARFCPKELSVPCPTAPVGSYAPNAWGLFDMHGNVWEWTADWFAADYFRRSPKDDPQGPPMGTHHTLRGGSASVQAHECTSAVRGEAEAQDGPEKQSMQRYAYIGDFGVRVVCEPASPT